MTKKLLIGAGILAGAWVAYTMYKKNQPVVKADDKKSDDKKDAKSSYTAGQCWTCSEAEQRAGRCTKCRGAISSNAVGRVGTGKSIGANVNVPQGYASGCDSNEHICGIHGSGASASIMCCKTSRDGASVFSHLGASV